MSLSPGESFDIVLDGDKDKPKPLTFHYQALSRREFRELMKVAEQHDVEQIKQEGGDPVPHQDKIIRTKLTGWSNMVRGGEEVKFDPENADQLDDVLSAMQASELMVKRVHAEQLGPDDRKKSESPAS